MLEYWIVKDFFLQNSEELRRGEKQIPFGDDSKRNKGNTTTLEDFPPGYGLLFW